MHHLILVLSYSAMLIQAYTYEPAETVMLTEGQNATFTCIVYPTIWRSGRAQTYYAKYDKYLCKDPCGPHDWNLIVTSTDKNIAPNQDPRFRITKIQGANGARITIHNVKSTDTGIYWCGIQYPSSDMYKQLRIIVIKPPKPSNILSIHGTISPTTKTESNHLDNSNNANHREDTMQKALKRCNDNSACALALIHKKELKIQGDCWICHALAARWQARPLTINLMTQNNMQDSQDDKHQDKCAIPQGMTSLIIAGHQIRNNIPIAPLPNISCTDPQPISSNMVFEVPLQHAETCVCSTSSSGPFLGQSSCQTKIFVNTTSSTKCSHKWLNNTLTRFTCPFKRLSSQPGIMWSCGKKAYHNLPPLFQWSGCCHPSVVTTDTTIFQKKIPAVNVELNTHFRAHRDITGIPSKFDGYVLADPWTSPSANVGWSIFLGGGTAATLNKINGLAWSVLSLANQTEKALTLMNNEMFAIRTAVIQHRLVLDIILAEKGGICKLLNVSCCFYVPDEYENITDIVKHMQNAIRPPPVASNSWFSWFESWGEEWSSWFLTMVMPIVVVIFLFCTLTPCVLKIISKMITKRIVQSSIYVHATIDSNDQSLPSFNDSMSCYYSDLDSIRDSDDDME
ncbi:uncharacterized protein V6R79_001523 [Siganus canaliculatus]